MGSELRKIDIFRCPARLDRVEVEVGGPTGEILSLQGEIDRLQAMDEGFRVVGDERPLLVGPTELAGLANDLLDLRPLFPGAVEGDVGHRHLGDPRFGSRLVVDVEGQPQECF